MNALRFSKDEVQRLWQRVWDAEERYKTPIDEAYGQDDDESGLPCIIVCVEDYGVFLTGNTEVNDNEEVWCLDYDPNTEENSVDLAKRIRSKFQKVETRYVVHLSQPPSSDYELVVVVDLEGGISGSCIQSEFITDR